MANSSSLKVDFDVELAEEAGQNIAADDLKPGAELRCVAAAACSDGEAAATASSSGRLQLFATTTQHGAELLLLGTVPEAVARRLQGGGLDGREPPLRVTVRSVKRQPAGGGGLASVTARAVRGASGGAAATAAAAGAMPAPPPPDDPSGYAVTAAQLARLADDPQIVLALRDERLQSLLLRVDGARDRERALEGALQADAGLRAFADAVLARMAGPQDGGSGGGAGGGSVEGARDLAAALRVLQQQQP